MDKLAYQYKEQKRAAGVKPAPPTVDYSMSVQTYNIGGSIIREDNCFSFMFTNLGNVIALVNGMIIYPSATPGTALGDSRSISAHESEVYKGPFNLSFRGAGNNPLVEIVQLFYAAPY